ncbi:MAG: oxidoreductase [Verrucomicrobiaceae bacterium]|nr:oxidoreductase [Verrucomicrobiaceae bacterium]
MSDTTQLLTTLGLSIVAAPVLLLAVFFSVFLLHRRLGEEVTGKLIQSTISISLLAAVSAAVIMLWQRVPQHPIELGDWVITPHYHLKFEFVLDLLSLSYVMLTLVLCAVIGAFSTRYLHREPGYQRFFVLFAIFLLGMVTASLSETVETLFAGWEMVGLSSVLLIAFFHELPAPPRNGLRVWIVYRFCDVALLLAAILMHEINGAGDFDHLVGEKAWPAHDPLLIGPHFTMLGVLFVIAAAGKSALVPFSGWLPRAMEGPTPSSAVFYGALSVHLGAFLLLRVSPVLDSSIWLQAAVVVLGLSTSAFAYLAGRVQSDIKSALAFASLTQVGIIIAEIGLGFRYLALLHLLGHACLRTLQFLRAPSLLHDHHQLENAIGSRPHEEGVLWEQKLPLSTQRRLYRFALERGYLDSLLEKCVARPFVAFFRGLDALETKWARLLDGETKAKEAPRDL